MKRLILIFLFLIFTSTLFSQEEKEIHQFTMLHQVKTTPVKNQGRSGTCWVFATTSFVETELLRLGFDETDLSEMFTVRYKLFPMAEKYIRYHGTSNFGEGGQAHDLLDVVSKYGFVPESVYSGMNIGLDVHNHGEMTAVLTGILDGILKKKSGKLTPVWEDVVESTLDIYLGTPPQKFEYNDKEYTPKSFQEETGFNPNNYIEITSYTDVPFYDKYNLPLPDNWSNSYYYNVPIDELVEIVDHSLKNGYSVCWDGDSGRDHFLRDECYAVIPEKEKDKDEKVTEPEKEMVITQEMRQEAFDNFDVTDDHLMHFTGIAENQNGTKFYYTKNSWGTKDRKYDGYWYMSETYVRLKTVAILVHKDAIPKEIRVKLGV
jgi:bleomycin hydrolase